MRVIRIVLGGVVLVCFGAAVAPAAVIALPPASVTAFSHYHPDGGPILDSASSANATPPSQGAYVQPSFAATVTGQDTVTLRIVAPAGKEFVALPKPRTISGTILAIAEWADTSHNVVFAGVAPRSVSAVFVTPRGGTVAGFVLPTQSFMAPDVMRFHESVMFNAFAPLEFTELDITATYNFSVGSPSSVSFSPIFFKLASDGAVSSTGSDIALLALQPVPEPSAAGAVLFATAALVGKRGGRPRGG
jgi:hypothetical protein